MPPAATLTPPRPPGIRTDHDDHGLTAAQLRALLDPLAADYRAAIVRTAALPNPERVAALRERIAAYSLAFSAALGDATDDATAILRGPRRMGGRR